MTGCSAYGRSNGPAGSRTTIDAAPFTAAGTMADTTEPAAAARTGPASSGAVSTAFDDELCGSFSNSPTATPATKHATPIDHFDWALNTASTNEGAGHCGSVAGIACGTVGGLSTRSATATITIPGSGEHWGDNYLYVSAVDKAGNVSPYARYDFFLAQAFVPVHVMPLPL